MIAIPNGTEIAGTYRVEARLGHGAFGTVYRVQHRFLGRMALKILECGSDEDIERLAGEGAAHGSLSHPNITRVYDVNVSELSGDRFVYIVSEYMPMGDLHDHLRQVHRLHVDEWIVLADGILAALAYAHDQPTPVLHRDVTPGNILVGGAREPTFKLGDFGVSTRLGLGPRIAKAAGTLFYLAPECSLGQYLAESDVYSAAVVLYRALTGTYPFAANENLGDPANYRAKQNPAPPSKFLLDCSADLDEVMLRGLAPDPFDRYRSALEFRAAILDAAASPRRSRQV